MSARPERLTKLLDEVAQERLGLHTGSPTDAEVARDKLADLAECHIPDLVYELRAAAARLATTEAERDAATARATKAESRAAEAEQRAIGLRGVIAARNLNAHDEMKSLRLALWQAEHALANCYDVTEWPADGRTEADATLTVVRKALYPPNGFTPAPLPSSPAAAGPERECHECGDDYNPNCLTCREEVGEPDVIFAAPTPAGEAAAHCCHGHSLESHRARCRSTTCDHKNQSPAPPQELVGKEGEQRG